MALRNTDSFQMAHQKHKAQSEYFVSAQRSFFRKDFSLVMAALKGTKSVENNHWLKQLPMKKD